MLWEIGVLICSIALLLLAIFAVPTILQIRRTAKSAEITFKTVNQNLPGILTNLDEITTNLTATSQSIHQNIDGFKEVIHKFHLVADDVVQFERVVREEIEEPILNTIGTFTGIVKGVNAFFEVWRKKS